MLWLPRTVIETGWNQNWQYFSRKALDRCFFFLYGLPHLQEMRCKRLREGTRMVFRCFTGYQWKKGAIARLGHRNLGIRDWLQKKKDLYCHWNPWEGKGRLSGLSGCGVLCLINNPKTCQKKTGDLGLHFCNSTPNKCNRNKLQSATPRKCETQRTWKHQGSLPKSWCLYFMRQGIVIES